MIERTYIDLLPIFEATGKKNYVEIVCGTMVENLYGTVGEKTLHLVRMNRTFPLYTGRDRWGTLMAHKAIDDHVEGQQPWYGSLGTNPENKQAFCEASIHVTFYKQEGPSVHKHSVLSKRHDEHTTKSPYERSI